MDLVPNECVDNRRLEVVADKLPLFGGRNKARTYSGDRRARLVILAAEVGGRCS